VPDSGAEGDPWFAPIRSLGVDPIDECDDTSAEGERVPERPAEEIRIQIPRPNLQEGVGTWVHEPYRNEIDPQFPGPSLEPNPSNPS
jgi:hypothetical protein